MCLFENKNYEANVNLDEIKKFLRDVNEQKTINWKNKKIKIKWPCIKPILSTRDKIEV